MSNTTDCGAFAHFAFSLLKLGHRYDTCGFISFLFCLGMFVHIASGSHSKISWAIGASPKQIFLRARRP